MTCARCPMFLDYGGFVSCVVFGNGWNNRLQYHGDPKRHAGCYIEEEYIEKLYKIICENENKGGTNNE